MNRIKFIVGLFAILGMGLAVFYVLGHEKTLVTHPKGLIARSELDLIATNYLLMLIIVIPTFIALFTIAWKYRSNGSAKHEPEKVGGLFGDILLWAIPSVIIAVMATHTWYATHKLDPYQPIESDVKTLKIQVVALDWKWLFIYPEQGIATLNFVQFPAKTPVHFELAADGSPMNSFWLPELSGQIYAMTGMITPLHVMADGPGEYRGRAAEINGRGYADMTFVAKSSTLADFESWVALVKQSPLQLNYEELVKPSANHPVALYPYIEKNLFHTIVMKYMP